MIKHSKRTVTQEIEDTTYICDLCGKEAEASGYSAALKNCKICGKQVCRPCRIGTDSLTSRYVSGDYPLYRVCVKCWDTGEPYRKRMVDVREKAELERDAILEEWKGEQ